RYLKHEKKLGVKCIAVEPASSPVLSGGAPGKHKIQGIGAGFVPDILDRSIIDEILQITDDEAIAMAKKMMKLEGITCGISCGAAMAATLKVAARPEAAGKTIVTILPDSGERYLSTALFEDLRA
ncbi:MAG: pyridoxal-phosphate dependent enzyme, partial [Planctomycetes bacterium]|nr:pyridoxal-phosphate dependent enzyme [Planctomycetota bacterium]